MATTVRSEDRQDAGLILVPGLFAVRIGAREATLTRTQFRLFSALHAAPSKVFSRAELVAHGIGGRVSERTVDVHIKEIRRKLGPDRWRIETVLGQGYCYRLNLSS